MTRPPLVVIKKTRPAPVRAPREKSRLEDHSFLPKSKPNPLATAKHWLGARLVERPEVYLLDGCPASLDTIMRATNALIAATGGEQIVYKEAWRV